MKCNVKGLVFVGFAAAILSANAMAATGDEKIVTSKAFTEATYQAKTAANKGGKVLKMNANNEAGAIDYMDVDTTVTASSGNLVTSGAVATAIADQGIGNKQGKSSANFQVGGENGAWNQIGTDSYVNVAAGTDANAGKAMFTINATTDGTLPAADSAKLVTAGAVKTYADNKIAASITDGDETHAPSGDAVNDALALKQNASTAVTFDGTNATGSTTQPVYIAADGTATPTTYALNKTVPADAVFTDTTYTADSTTITLSNGQFSATTGNVASNNNGLVTGATVYSYISALPAVNVPASCTDAAPCALVATTSGAAWVAMSQPSAQQ